jgi:hypothetical protein
MLFHDYYERLAMYRKDIIIPFGFLSMLIQVRHRVVLPATGGASSRG